MRRFAAVLGSLKLTVILLVLSLCLVLAGTFAQMAEGLYYVKKTYFETVFVAWPLANGWRLPIFPGGFLLAGLLLANLTAAAWVRLPRRWATGGTWLVHLGLLLLIAGSLASALLQEEYTLELAEGESRSFAEDPRAWELAVTIPGQEAPAATFAAGPDSVARTWAAAGLPFTVRVEQFHANAALVPLGPGDAAAPAASQGTGQRLRLHPLPPARPDPAANRPALLATIEDRSGALGTWLLAAGLETPQSVASIGQTWQLCLRPRRLATPWSLRLLEFRHDRYPGTQIARNYSSLVEIAAPGQSEARRYLIYMNHPLRYGGCTYYQSSYKDNDRSSVLLVVRNPGWPAPYLACTLVALGLLWQFGRRLHEFRAASRERLAPVPAAPPALPAGRPWGLWLVLAASLVLTLAQLQPPRRPGGMDLPACGRLPVLANGRLKPLDTVARSSLLAIHGSQSLRWQGRRIEPLAWLLDCAARPEAADDYPLFLIDDPRLVGLMGIRQEARRFSFNQLRPVLAEIEHAAREANALPAEQRQGFPRAALQLYERLLLYRDLKNTLAPEGSADFAAELQGYQDQLPALANALQAPPPATSGPDAATLRNALARYGTIAELAGYRPIPRSANGGPPVWNSVGEALLQAPREGRMHPAVSGYAELLTAWRRGDAAAFNAAVAKCRAAVPSSPRIGVEFVTNYVQPFYLAMCLYVAAFLLAGLGWLRPAWSGPRAAVPLLGLALALHTAGLALRSYLHGYAPVTNLYSSAVFVGWGAVLLGLGLERVFRNGAGAAVAALAGFATQIVAHHLALGGDTMEMMRAVLDSNFWLSTHVLTITVGYSGMFLAGGLGACWLLRDLLHRPAADDSLERMVYGVLCFSAFFSFVGTVLGGIWADQSWGRFWGWDPKENGALLIVLWTALILHARADRILSPRGLMLLAVGGNVVTAFAWFGVNLMGVGLHAYGFMERGLFWLLAFAASQFALIVMGLLPVVSRPAAQS